MAGNDGQILGWNIRITRDQANSITCCNLPNNAHDGLYIAGIQCLAGAIGNLAVTHIARNCGMANILVRLCMNADSNGQSLHAINSNENTAMNYMRSRMFHADDPRMHMAYHLLLGQAEARCDRIMMVQMNLAPNTREWRKVPRMYFDSAQHAMYDSIAYEYIDDFDDSFAIDPSYDGTHFASLDGQADSFHYDQNEAEFARARGFVIRKRVVGPGAYWYFCSTPW